MLPCRGRVLREMINQTAFAAAPKDDRPILTGVYTLFDGNVMTMAAADGYRLAVRTTELDQTFDEPRELVIPAKALNEIARIVTDDDEVTISLPERRDIVTFHMPNVDVSSQLLEGKFPDFRAIIPRVSYVTSTVMYTSDLLKVCQRAEIFARDNANSANLQVRPATNPGEPSEVFVTGRSNELGDSEGMLDASQKVNPSKSRSTLNISLKCCASLMKSVSSSRAMERRIRGVLRPENRDDFIHVIMPMSR